MLNIMNTYILKNRSLILLLLLIIISVALLSCNKEKASVGKQPLIIDNGRKPIALTDIQTGEMNYRFELNRVQSVFNANLNANCTKDLHEYIVESICILPKALGVNDSDILEVCIVDVENETSETIWFDNGFIESLVLSDNSINYFFNESVSSGSYVFVMGNNERGITVTVNDGDFSSTTNDGICYSNIVPVIVSCKGHNCNASTCQPIELDGYKGCSPCSVIDDHHWCEQTITADPTLFIQLAIAILGAVI